MAPKGRPAALCGSSAASGRRVSGGPGDRDAWQCSAEALQAPGDVPANLDSVPADVTYRAVSEIRATLGRAGITDRRRRMRVAVRV